MHRPSALFRFHPTLVLRDPQNIEVVMTGDFNLQRPRYRCGRAQDDAALHRGQAAQHVLHHGQSGRDFVDYLHGPKKQAFDILSTYCSASIAASVFGIHTEKSTMDSPFLEMAQKAVKPTTSLNLKIALVTLFPKLMSILRIRLFGNFEKFFIGAIKQVLRVREKQNTKTHDFAELCVELQRKGTLRDAATGYEIEPTDEVMAAQAFFFFIAGVEPSATSMFFALFELAKHPDILDKLHEEVDDLFERSNDNPTYEDTLHKTGGVLPVGQIHVDKGTLIHIPVYALHRDPKYYPEPESFYRSDLATKEKEHYKLHLHAFRNGHRMCLGNAVRARQVRRACCNLLRHFTVETRDAHTEMKFGKLPQWVRPLNIDLQFVSRG
ncbi:hypothetical protein EVAR_100514_1 [Eumeta japonica]|uniref:unspecific monooxygenase n=1 Tax=Eumeta variegata TaxID=151549 RepID=A0A4C2A6E7_EUMVA|nr:hypothetical protein EVAR_100514_1 [Eumeta japonica]